MAVESGIVTEAQALLLFLYETPAELHKVERAGWIKRTGPDRWPLIPLVQGHAKYWKWRATTATTAELAQIWGVTKQFIGQLVDQGWFKPLEGHRGVFNTADAHNGFIRYLRDEGRRTTKSAAESRVRDARAQEIEMRVALRSGDLMKRAEHEETLDEVLGFFRSELSGLPARLTRDLRERGRIEQAVNDILESIAALAAKSAGNLAAARSGRADTVAADNAGQVGS
jgi:phage terminase Nu1 subunit (DNA packaging protein)